MVIVFFINKEGKLKLGQANSYRPDFETIIEEIERYVKNTGKTDWHKNPECLLSVIIENLTGTVDLTI